MTPSRDIGRLLEIMAALRTAGTGCPWDLAQNFSTIAPYTLEEAYEVADAIARNDLADLKDELGDLLLQVVFHARMAEEEGAFAFGDVVQAITEKLIRRHPHVFGDDRSRTPQAVEGLWERIKAEERAARHGSRQQGALAGVPVALPALTRALKLQEKASQVGFDWNDVRAVLDKIREEADEIEAALGGGDAETQSAPPKPPRKSATCCLPPSTLPATCTPTRQRCCGRPTKNSSAASLRSKTLSPPTEKRRVRPHWRRWTSSGM